ncbi:MAG: hypothetical protein R2822_12265 [Spirosomataceae bacterium]
MKYKGFKSMSKAYRDFETQNNTANIDPTTLGIYKNVYKINEINGEKLIEKAVVGPILSTILNHDGLLQIGDKILRINDEKVKIVAVKDIAELDKSNSKLVEEHFVEKIPVTLSKKNARGSGLDDWEQNEVVQEYQPSGLSKRRITRRLWAYNYYIGVILGGGPQYMYETGAILIHERKNWWGWAVLMRKVGLVVQEISK